MARPRKDPNAPKKPRKQRAAILPPAEPAVTLESIQQGAKSILSFGIELPHKDGTVYVLPVAAMTPHNLPVAYVTQNAFMLNKANAYEPGQLFLNLPQGIKTSRYDLAVVADGEIKSAHWAFKLGRSVLVKKPLIAQVAKESGDRNRVDLGEFVYFP